MRYVRRRRLAGRWMELETGAPPVTPAPPTPVASTFTIGIGGWEPGYSFSYLYAQAKTTMGSPHVGIYFPSGTPITFDSRCALIQDDAILAVTFKDWSPSRVEAFAAAASQRAGLTYINWVNEVDVKGSDPVEYKLNIATISQIARQYSNVRSFTQVTELGIRLNRVAPYLSGVDVDCFGWSIFGGNANIYPPQQVNNIVRVTRQYGGSDMPFEVFGWASAPEIWGVEGRAAWLTAGANALRQAGCAHAFWFNRTWPDLNERIDDDPVALAAWTAQVIQNPDYEEQP